MGRKPVLLLRFARAFLLRLAARRFAGLLFQPAPRNTRRHLARIPREAYLIQQTPAQSLRIRVYGMTDPTGDGTAHLGQTQLVTAEAQMKISKME